jgi:hypothetical protein
MVAAHGLVPLRLADREQPALEWPTATTSTSRLLDVASGRRLHQALNRLHRTGQSITTHTLALDPHPDPAGTTSGMIGDLARAALVLVLFGHARVH